MSDAKVWCQRAVGLVGLLALVGLAACSASDESAAGAGLSDENASGNNSDNSASNNSTNNGGGSWNNANSSSGNNASNNNPNNPDSNNANNQGGDEDEGGNTNINLSGAQDFGYFRRLLDQGIVPVPEDMDPAGFFAEHHTPLPEPTCGERICVQGMLGVMGNLVNGNNCTLLQIGLNSPLTPDPENRPPLNLTVVVDVSGSMQAAGKIDFVRLGLSRMLNELRDGDRMALVTYSDEAQVRVAMTDVGSSRNDLTDAIERLSPDGGTNIYDGLEVGYQESLRNYDSGRQNRVIFLSDGEPTVGNTSAESILQMSRAYNSDGAGLTSVGLGTDFNISLMSGLAQQADGNFYFVEDAGAVDEVFTEELSYFTVPVAFDLELTMTTGEDYGFLRAVGSHFWETTETGGRLEVPSVFLAHRTSHDDVTEDGGRRGGGSALLVELMPRAEDGSDPEEADVAKLELSFREPGSNEVIREVVEVAYPYSPWDTLAIGYFENEIVEKSFVMLNIYSALELACQSFYNGNPTEGVATLELLIAAASDYEDSANAGQGDEDIKADIELMVQLRDLLLRQGGTDPSDEELPEDPWPAD
jgi:Ca-activated chloride channel family protein